MWLNSILAVRSPSVPYSILPEEIAVISTYIDARVNNSVNESWSSRCSNNTSKEPTVSQITLSNIFNINSSSTWHKWKVDFCLFWSHIIAKIPISVNPRFLDIHLCFFMSKKKSPSHPNEFEACLKLTDRDRWGLFLPRLVTSKSVSIQPSISSGMLLSTSRGAGVLIFNGYFNKKR